MATPQASKTKDDKAQMFQQMAENTTDEERKQLFLEALRHQIRKRQKKAIIEIPAKRKIA